MSRGRRTPRQADIAKIAGVSQTTVSVVLGGNRTGVRLSERTRLRVLEVAEQLGYVPDQITTRLPSHRNNLLGVYTFTPAFPADIAGSYYPILAGIEAEAAELGQDLIMFTASGAAPGDTRIRRTRLADGCLFLGGQASEEPMRELADSGFPVVCIGRPARLDDRIPYVAGDYFAASAEVVTRLVLAGHRKIRYVREPEETLPACDRERGVLAAATEHGLDLRGLVVRTDGADSGFAGATTITGWLAEGVTALVIEETDSGALFHAVRRGVRVAGVPVPAGLSLAVLGRPPEDYSGPEVSGFEVPRRALGQAAVRLLAALLDQLPGLPVEPRLLACPPIDGSTIMSVRNVT
jgi:DNA-binding LacI/PurR family transcriptional regulator